MAVSLAERLRLAREVLGGTDSTGRRSHPSMFDRGIISLAHGDGTRRPEAGVVAAGIAALLNTSQGSLEDYLFLRPYEEFETALTSNFIQHRVPPELAGNLCVGSGTTRLFSAFLHACAEPGDVFLVPRSYYHPLPSWCELASVQLELVPTERSSDYKITPEALDRWCELHRDTRARGLFLFNPTQTGALYSETELTALAETIGRTDLVVLEDSVFAGTEFPGQPEVCHLVAAAPHLADRVVTLKGGSKAYNLANIRIGWGCGPDRIVRPMNDYITATSATVPFLAKAMALAALRAPAGYLHENAVECARRADLICSLVDESNAALSLLDGQPVLTVVHRPQAGHAVLVSASGLAGLPMPDGSAFGTSLDVTRFLLSAARVATSPGYSIGFDGWELRLVFGSVGVRNTYTSSTSAELSVTLNQVAGLCGRSRPDLARSIHELTEQLIAGDSSPEADCFEPGRAQIVAAFRQRIIPAIGRLLATGTPLDPTIRAKCPENALHLFPPHGASGRGKAAQIEKLSSSATQAPEGGGLRGNRDFRLFWAGETVSLFGAQVTLLALPLTALSLVDADTSQLGILRLCEYLPFLLFALPFGVLADRLPRRPILIAANLVRAALVGLIPLLVALGTLSSAIMDVVALGVGTCTVLFDVSLIAYLPSLVTTQQLVPANSGLAVSQAAAEVSGPGLAGLLIRIFSAPVCLAVDAATYLVSVATLAFIRLPEQKVRPDASRKAGQEIFEGIAYLMRSAPLRAAALAGSLYNLAWSISQSAFLIYANRVLGFDAAVIGTILSVGALGGVAGAGAGPALLRRLSFGPVYVVATIVATVPAFAVPAIVPGYPVPEVLLASVFFVTNAGLGVYNVLTATLRQSATPNQLLGRVAACYRMLVSGALAVGGLMTTALGSFLDSRSILWAAALIFSLAVLPIVVSPLPRRREVPTWKVS